MYPPDSNRPLLPILQTLINSIKTTIPQTINLSQINTPPTHTQLQQTLLEITINLTNLTNLPILLLPNNLNLVLLPKSMTLLLFLITENTNPPLTTNLLPTTPPFPKKLITLPPTLPPTLTLILLPTIQTTLEVTNYNL